MNANDVYFLRTLAQLARGTSIELPLVGDFDSSDERVCEMAHTYRLETEIPALLWELSVTKRESDFSGSFIALRSLGLVESEYREFVLPSAKCQFITPDGDTVHLQSVSAARGPEGREAKTIVSRWGNGRFARESGTVMEWYALTTAGWKKESELEAEAASDPTQWLDGPTLVQKGYVSKGQLSKLAQQHPSIRRRATRQDQLRLDNRRIQWVYDTPRVYQLCPESRRE